MKKFKRTIFCNIINVFTVIFNQLNVSLIDVIISFKKEIK